MKKLITLCQFQHVHIVFAPLRRFVALGQCQIAELSRQAQGRVHIGLHAFFFLEEGNHETNVNRSSPTSLGCASSRLTNTVAELACDSHTSRKDEVQRRSRRVRFVKIPLA